MEGQEAKRLERGSGGGKVREMWILPSGKQAALTLPLNFPGALSPGPRL